VFYQEVSTLDARDARIAKLEALLEAALERTLTAVTSLKLQQRGALAFLTSTVHAHRRDPPTPSLLPTSDTLQLTNAA
jgi:hypothetical protein